MALAKVLVMNRRDFREQIDASAATVAGEIARGETGLRVEFFAAFLLDLGAVSPTLAPAAERFCGWRARTTEDEVARRLEEEGCVAFLRATWRGLGQSHYDGPELALLAAWLIALVRDARSLAALPYEIGNWNGTWRQVGAKAAAACEQIAAASLARDPEEERALYLYAQEDFRAAVNRSRPKGRKLSGPPIAPRAASDDLAKIARIVRLYEEDVVHPLDIPSLDTIALRAPEVVRAMLFHLETTSSWRAKLRIIEALGRAEVLLGEVTAALARALEGGDERTIDQVSMAAHYGLRARGVGLLSPLCSLSERMLASMREDVPDYGHLWPLRAVFTLADHATGGALEHATELSSRLAADMATMPAWKRERLVEFDSHVGRKRRRKTG